VRGEPACRPGSVHPRERGPAAIHLGLPLPTASCGLPASIGRAALNRSRRPRAPEGAGPCDLAPGGVYRAARITPGAGGLLHHRFTLTPGPAETWPGAVCSLWHCPAGHPGSVLPTTLPCGARTFLTGSCTHGPARPPGRLALPTKDRRLRPTGNALTGPGPETAAGVTKGRPCRKAAGRHPRRQARGRRRPAPWPAR
jgi:hypothetical protein